MCLRLIHVFPWRFLSVYPTFILTKPSDLRWHARNVRTRNVVFYGLYTYLSKPLLHYFTNSCFLNFLIPPNFQKPRLANSISRASSVHALRFVNYHTRVILDGPCGVCALRRIWDLQWFLTVTFETNPPAYLTAQPPYDVTIKSSCVVSFYLDCMSSITSCCCWVCLPDIDILYRHNVYYGLFLFPTFVLYKFTNRFYGR